MGWPSISGRSAPVSMWTAELIGPVSRVMLSVLSWLVRHPLGSERRPGQPAPAPWLMLRRRADRVGAGGSLRGCSAGWSLPGGAAGLLLTEGPAGDYARPVAGKPALGRRRLQHEAAKEEILEAAWGLARTRGLTGFSLRDLAVAVQMRHQSLYTYF